MNTGHPPFSGVIQIPDESSLWWIIVSSASPHNGCVTGRRYLLRSWKELEQSLSNYSPVHSHVSCWVLIKRTASPSCQGVHNVLSAAASKARNSVVYCCSVQRLALDSENEGIQTRTHVQTVKKPTLDPKVLSSLQRFTNLCFLHFSDLRICPSVFKKDKSSTHLPITNFLCAWAVWQTLLSLAFNAF